MIDPATMPKTPTAQLLEHYLPPTPQRTSADRLRAIAGKALKDGTPRIEHRLRAQLTPDERYDAHSYLTLTGLKCTRTYDPTLDRGTGSVPQEVRFGRFAYVRMRLALIDWERKQFGDRRPGRTRHPDMTTLHDLYIDEELDASPDISIEDLTASRDQAARWQAQAQADGLPLNAWIEQTLDQACGDRREAAA
jgi:hypothetical protein